MIDAARLVIWAFRYSGVAHMSLVIANGSLCRNSEGFVMATFTATSLRFVNLRSCRGCKRGFSTGLGKFFHDGTMKLGTAFSKFDHDRTKCRVRDGDDGGTQSRRRIFTIRISRWGAVWVRQIEAIEAWELWSHIQHSHIKPRGIWQNCMPLKLHGLAAGGRKGERWMSWAGLISVNKAEEQRNHSNHSSISFQSRTYLCHKTTISLNRRSKSNTWTKKENILGFQ